MNNAGCFDMSTFQNGFCEYHQGRSLLNAKVDMAAHQSSVKKISSLAP